MRIGSRFGIIVPGFIRGSVTGHRLKCMTAIATRHGQRKGCHRSLSEKRGAHQLAWESAVPTSVAPAKTALGPVSGQRVRRARCWCAARSSFLDSCWRSAWLRSPRRCRRVQPRRTSTTPLTHPSGTGKTTATSTSVDLSHGDRRRQPAVHLAISRRKYGRPPRTRRSVR